MEKTYKIIWNKPRDLNWLDAGNVKEALSVKFKDTEFEVEEFSELTGSEAVFAFFGFLARREESITIGDDVNPKVMMDLLNEFNRVNKLKGPRKNWAHLVRYPEE